MDLETENREKLKTLKLAKMVELVNANMKKLCGEEWQSLVDDIKPQIEALMISEKTDSPIKAVIPVMVLLMNEEDEDNIIQAKMLLAVATELEIQFGKDNDKES